MKADLLRPLPASLAAALALLCVPALHAQVLPDIPLRAKKHRHPQCPRRASDQGRKGLPVSTCSVLNALGFEEFALREAPALRARLVDDPASLECRLKPSDRFAGPWTTSGEVTHVAIRSRPVGPPLAIVELEVWKGPREYANETFEFVVSSDSIWSPTRYEELCCTVIHPRAEPARRPLVILNGALLPLGVSPDSALRRVSGHVVDSIRVYHATEGGIAAKYGSRAAANGVIVIGTHAPAGRP